MPSPLPIDAVLPELLSALRAHPRAVLQAPPGAGKTTRVPLALLEEPWLRGQRIVMLEPRRLATRAAAQRMARTLGERVGQTVGYRVRRDVRVSTHTRIEVVTEGILTRMLQSDPMLEGVGCLIFDEFHERSLTADLGLALTLDVQGALRDDLRLLVMSATLDGERVAALLSGGSSPPAPLITSEGRTYPVDTRYADTDAASMDRRPLWLTLPEQVADATRKALSEEVGSVLAFLPGAGEIRRAEALLNASSLPSDVRLAPLYGALDQRAQDAAIAPPPEGLRKVVLATPIAESSLTIEGVRMVIDGGYERVPRFSPRTGMTRLETVRISRASADQRRGRAGRTEPGVCYRLWGRLQQHHMNAFATPEIVEADLAPLALELAVWGIQDAESLRWLDPPSASSLAQARDLLRQLGALDRTGAATRHGRAMSHLGVHPRIAHLLIQGERLGLGTTACAVAALLGERDPLRSSGQAAADADLRLRLDLLRRTNPPPYMGGLSVDRGALRRIQEEARHLQRLLQAETTPIDPASAGLLVALAYPDRIAQRTSPTRYTLRTGHAAALSHDQVLSTAAYLAVAALDDRRGAAKIFAAAPLTQADLEEHFHESIEDVDLVEWDADAQRVVAKRTVQLGALVLREAPQAEPDLEAVATALVDGIRQTGLHALSWSNEARRLQDRMRFLHTHRDTQASLAGWPDVSDEALLETLEQWLNPHVFGMKRLEDTRKLNVGALLLALLDWPQRQALDRLAPTHLVVPSGSKRPLDYSNPEAPVLAVRLQEVFGLTETPTVLGGTLPLTVHLLSPAHRLVQVTQDLAGFWASSYFDVRKDLRGRYPKHHWPENPLEATPTARAKRRK